MSRQNNHRGRSGHIAAAARAALVGCALVARCSGTVHASPAQDYMLHCMGCHGADAEGVPGKVPPLANALTRFMRSPEGRNYVLRVPGAANSALSDVQLAAVLNWIVTTFDANQPSTGVSMAPAPFTPEEVTRQRRTPLASVLAARRAVVKSLAATGAAPPTEY